MYPNASNEYMKERNDGKYTRSKQSVNLQCPFPKTEMFRKGISYQGPARWSGLPHEIKNIQTLEQFKVAVKDYYWKMIIECQVV